VAASDRRVTRGRSGEPPHEAERTTERRAARPLCSPSSAAAAPPIRATVAARPFDYAAITAERCTGSLANHNHYKEVLRLSA